MEHPEDLSAVDLDGVLSTRPLPQVVAAMIPWLAELHAHPGSPHARGARARRAIEQARAEVSALVGAGAEHEIVFTSGATEARNLAFKGLARRPSPDGRLRLALAAHEHASLLHPARSVARERGQLVLLPVGRDGLLDAGLLEPGIDLLAFSHAHAELGSLQSAPELCHAARARNTLVFLDATLSAGRIPLDLPSLGSPALLALSFHHFGGPMGVGALVFQSALELAPLFDGGVEERGYRPGAPQLAGIVGAGVAAREARARVDETQERLERMGRQLATGLLRIEGVVPIGAPAGRRLPGHVSASVAGIDGEALLLALDEHGVQLGSGSPCSREAGLSSASLRAAGYSSGEARGSIVLCLSPTALPREAELERALLTLASEVGRLRRIAAEPL